MFKKWLFVAGLAGLLLIPRGTGAVIGTIDTVPAATLLVPYFEVDLAPGGSRTTLFSINNASATAVLAHVTLWTDLGVPTTSFNVYLTGYDVQTINVRDLLVTGNLPRTASAGQDPTNTISPKGQASQDINFASCTGQLPPAPMSAGLLQGLRDAHTGAPSAVLGGSCGGRALDGTVARGYITVDTVNNCTTRLPGDPGYFNAGGSGDATNQNVLWGDYFFVDPTNNFAQGDTLVHIEASATDPETSVPSQYTFYGRTVGWTAIDNREPLGSKFAARFVNGGAFTGGTNLVVWRDSKTNQAPFACGAPPADLVQQDLYAFDEQENPFELNTLTPFPARTQKVAVNSAALPVTPAFGWLHMNLNHAGGLGPASEDVAAAQNFVAFAMDASGRFSVGQSAIQLESATAATSTCLSGSLVASRCQ